MLVSLIIPTFNRAGLLREALQSAQHQSEWIREIIVCDDGSTDNTPEVCREFDSPATPVVFSRSHQNQGAQVARNRGLAIARGEFILFLDSDDALVDGGLLPFLTALQDDPGLDYAHGLVVRTDSHLTPVPGQPPVGAAFGPEPREIAGYHWHTAGAIYRKAYLSRVGGWNETLTGSQDWEYQARVKIANGRGRFIDHVLASWRAHDGARVGALQFRQDYVRSVILACRSIHDTARLAGIQDRSLSIRLSKKSLLHALEFGSHGCRAERQWALSETRSMLAHSPPARALVALWQLMPSSMDRAAWNRLNRRR